MLKYFLIVFAFILASCAPKTATTSPTPQPTSVNIKASVITPPSSPTPLPEIAVGIVEVDTLNVREGPGTSYPTIGSLSKGEKFYILGEITNSTNNKWLLLSLSEATFGWVIGEQTYVRIQAEAVDYLTYFRWEKDMTAAKSMLTVPTATAIP